MIHRAFSGIYGNDTLCEMLSSHIAGDTLPHAYILEGPAGSGRHTLASAVACALYPEEEAKIRAGNCPDIIPIMLEGERKSMGIETVRTLRSDAYISPNELDGKLYIISDADTMTVQAQNAFLKLLEEPPRHVRFLLLCENATALIPTVRSRAPTLKMRVFSADALSAYLTETDAKAASLQSSDPEAFAALVRLSDGCIGKAKKLLASRKREESGDSAAISALLHALLSDTRFSFVQAVDALPSKREGLQTVLRSFRLALRDILLIKGIMLRDYSEDAMATAAQRLLFFRRSEEAEAFAARMTDTAIMRLSAVAEQTDDALRANGNLSHAKLKMALDMRDAVGK